MKRLAFVVVPLAAVLLSALPSAAAPVESQASPPKGVTIAVYDAGYGLVSELRSVTLAKGENLVTFGRLPPRIDAASASLIPISGGKFEVLEQQFRYDLADVSSLLNRYLGKPVEVTTPAGVRKGTLVSASGSGNGLSLALSSADGSVAVLAGADAPSEISFPDAARTAFLEPAILWRADAAQEGPLNLRLSYVVPGLSWDATYDAILSDEGREAYLAARASVKNDTGTGFPDARIRLVATEKGAAGGGGGVLRYSYGRSEPDAERSVAAAGAVGSYDLARPLTLARGETAHVQLRTVERLPVSRFYVYDGVRFDRFQRNRRNDWNYGTECHRTVETRLQFSNTKDGGLGTDLPPGTFRLYEQNANGALELVGEDRLPAVPAGGGANLLMGPARGLVGERERTGYSEITPLHEYEESFEIRLENNTTEEVEIRVVEHLYRSDQFDVVKADTDYTGAGPQTIEFRPVLKPGGKRSVHYTVRYRW